MNKFIYLGLILGGSLVGIIMNVLGTTSGHMTELLYFSWIPSLVGAITWLVLIYKMWAAIPAEFARATPGKALGFMFIPIFNLYWIWVVFVGFAQDYNQFVQAKHPNVAALDVRLFMAQVILLYCSIIPFLGILSMLASLVIALINITKICDGVNAVSSQDPYAAATA